RELVRVGRTATAVVVLLGLLWIPAMKLVSGALYEYLQSVQAYLAPPMTAVFFMGVFWKRLNGAGAVTALVSGFVVGMAKLACQVYAGMLPDAAQVSGLAGVLVGFGTINFLKFCVFLFLFCAVVLTVVSLLTPPPDPRRIENLTYATVTGEGRQEIRASWNRWDVLHTIVVLGLILCAYLYFTG
ncbi:MAG TPA: Na+/glucose cotransporter, partial [Candidatus Hydrogenedentes bacterium]|nr:Na+/glucose cotransporter [Candidatus Hydrogenedentota bacterium]